MLLGVVSAAENYIKIETALAPKKTTYLRHYDVNEMRSLSEFVARGRNIMNFEMLAIYLDDIEEKSDIVSAVKMFKTLSDARLIVIAENTSSNKELVSELAEKCRVYNSILLGDNTDFDGELEVCLSEEGKTLKNSMAVKRNGKLEALRRATSMKLNIPKGFCLNIGVAGVGSRVGTTTQAMLIYAYLKTIGFTPCLIDKSGKTIETMSLFYDDVGNRKDLHTFNGVLMADEKPGDGKINAYVYDFGVLKPSNVSAFSGCDFTYLCSGSKPWELTDVANALTSFEQTQNCTLLFAFAGDTDKQPIKDLLDDAGYKYSFVPFLPDIFTLENWQFYAQLMLALVRDKVNKCS